MPDSAIGMSENRGERHRAGGVRFLLGGRVVELDDVALTTPLLTVLRERLGRVGSKEGCGEGDCGACTVVVAHLQDGAVRFGTVNACIQLLGALDGKAVFTVEDVRATGGALHPAQQAMVDCHGSQCGFCTPGFVMSLWCLYESRAPSGASERELRTALSGNLCRCTGYRPIIAAGQRMFELARPGTGAASDSPLAAAALAGALRAIARDKALDVTVNRQRFVAPRSLDELTRLRAAHPQATLLAGGTDVGLWVTKQLRELPMVVYLGAIGELARVETRDGALSIGAAVSLEDAYVALRAHYPQLAEMHERFASLPVRNAGTLGGNVANGSPIGDSMPWLIALGARVVLRGPDAARTIALEDLYVDYMKKSMRADEFVQAVEVPLPAPGRVFRTYKVSKRYDSDISAVCAAFALEMQGDRIASARIAFGGMAATPRRAPGAERALTGAHWDERAVERACDALDADYAPIADMRASAGYRRRVARNLLRRFHLETRPGASPAATSVFAIPAAG